MNPILCVDDEISNLGLMREILEEKYPLVFASNFTDAISMANKHLPRLILLDLQMPEGDGFNVIIELKKNPKTMHIPVILVSLSRSEQDEERGFALGAVDFITKPFSTPILRARIHSQLQLVQATQLQKSYHSAIHMLGNAGHHHDNDTGVHIWRMGSFAHLIALKAGWNENDAHLIQLAAPMHDTGKIGISDVILKKTSALSADEWTEMKKHPQIGYEILKMGDGELFSLAAEISLNHHEKWDGSGYPNALSGDMIPESGRIVAIADVFDALSMKRPYKEAWELDQIIAEFERLSGSHFEPRLVQIFKDNLPQIIQLQHHWALKEQSIRDAEEIY